MTFHRSPHTFVGQVDLKVTDLKRSLAFYQQVIGFQILEQTERKAILTADGKTALLSLEQPDNAKAKETHRTGLYHFAILLPNRSDLARIIKHFIRTGYPLQGASDHYVSEALYLGDPDGNGIEIYTDRPATSWAWNNNEVVMATERLDIESILAEDDGNLWDGLPANTLMGHIHLHVSELQRTEEFYCKGLGFEVVNRYGGQALFISTGGYHHHIGLNTWSGLGAPAPSENSAGLSSFSLVLPNEEARDDMIEKLKSIGALVEEKNGAAITKDPSGNEIRLTV